MVKTLNLVNPEKSDIKYKISQFPDGQQQVTITEADVKIIEKNGNQTTFNFLRSIEIKSRLNNFRDLELIICAVASLREKGFKTIELYTPYFLGSRSDRKFEEGSNNYLKTVICPIINSLGFTKVTVLDPHSDVLEACLNNFNKINNNELVKWFINNNVLVGNMPNGVYNGLLIAPDAGSVKKITKLTEDIPFLQNFITCSKSRDVDGKLTKTFVPLNATLLNKDFIIIDDICDGGATFINIAKEIKKWDTTNSCKIHLIVTHGIFSKGFEELNKYFDGIYCTNSYSDVPDYYDNGMQKFKTNVKQLDVF